MKILNDVSKTASRLGADKIGKVIDFYSDLLIKGFTRNTYGSSFRVNFRLNNKLLEDLIIMEALTNGQFKSEINSAFTSTDIKNSVERMISPLLMDIES